MEKMYINFTSNEQLPEKSGESILASLPAKHSKNNLNQNMHK